MAVVLTLRVVGKAEECAPWALVVVVVKEVPWAPRSSLVLDEVVGEDWKRVVVMDG